MNDKSKIPSFDVMRRCLRLQETKQENEQEKEDLPPFDPSKCTCSVLGVFAPCGYCESGQYDIDKYDAEKRKRY